MKLLMNPITKQLITRYKMIDDFCSSYNHNFEGPEYENVESLSKAKFWSMFGAWAEGLIECGTVIVIDSASEMYAFEPFELELRNETNLEKDCV